LRKRSTPRSIAPVLVRGLVAVVIVLALSSAASAAKTPYQVEFESFSFASGTRSGTVASGAGSRSPRAA
jgi:hypothetical protein